MTKIHSYQDALDYIYSFADYSKKRTYRYSADVFNLSRVRILLKELGDRLWQRYEQEFLLRSIEQEQQEALRSDSHDNEYPF